MTTECPLVWLPGMMCDARLFEPLGSRLADADIHVLPVTDHATIDALAHDVLAGLPDRRVVLGGFSMGGIVAMRVADLAPERLAALILMDTNHLPEPESRWPRRLAQIERVQAGGLAHVLTEELMPFYLGPDHAGDPALQGVILDMAHGLGPAVFERQSRALATRPDASPGLARFPHPTLVLHGEHDRMCPPARHVEMSALLPQARLAVVPRAGHFAPLEEPEATARIVGDFLNNL